MKILSKAHAEELFRQNAILICQEDVIPVQKAKELFGVEAVEYALKRPNASNAFGVGDFDFVYMHHSAYLVAVSYYNVQQLRNEYANEDGRSGCDTPPYNGSAAFGGEERGKDNAYTK